MKHQFFRATLFSVLVAISAFGNTTVVGATAVSAEKQDANKDTAVAAMKRGDYAKAYCIMRPMAEAGDAESQYNIGWMYRNGYGLRIDDQQALEWWTKASDQGDTDASFSIGMLYSKGEGNVARDLVKAIDYYLIAERGGQEDAVKLLKNIMMYDDKKIRNRLHKIMNQLGSKLGKQLRVKVKELNMREEPSIKAKVITRLAKGQKVLELRRKGKWSQVVVPGNKEINQAVWTANLYLE